MTEKLLKRTQKHLKRPILTSDSGDLNLVPFGISGYQLVAFFKDPGKRQKINLEIVASYKVLNRISNFYTRNF